VAREQARVEPLAGGRTRLASTSATVPIGLPDGTARPPGGTCELPLPAVLTLGPKVVRVQTAEAADDAGAFASLSDQLRAGRGRGAD
jgi:hypothetical protein